MKPRTVLLRICPLLLPIVWVAALSADTNVVTHPFEGITRIDYTQTSPQQENMHIVEVDLTAPGISFAVTPQGGALDTYNQTTLGFLQQQNAQVAINGNFFVPFPSVNGTANDVGLAASAGNVYSPFEPQPVAAGQPNQDYAIVPYGPAINIAPSNNASIVNYNSSYSDGKHVIQNVTLWNAISGSAQIVTNGVLTIPVYQDANNPAGLLTSNGTYSNSNSWYNATNARTIMGLSADGKTLVLFTVDAAGGSAGMTVGQAASFLMSNYGVYNAINLDGGGSTTMAMENPSTLTDSIINTSSDNPAGRAVGLNFAVFAQPTPEPATIGLLVGGAAFLLARRRRIRSQSTNNSRKEKTMRSVSFIIAAVGVGLVLIAASSAQASPISQPYFQNFDSIAVGGSMPNESIGSAGTSPTANTWAVVADGNGNHWYQNVLTGGSVKGTDSLQFSNLGPATPADNFDIQTIVQAASTFSPVSGINYTAGLRFLAASSSVSSAYAVDLNFGANPGRMRLVSWSSGGAATVLPSSTQSSQPLVPNFSLSDSYLLDVQGTYSGSSLTLTCTATQTNNAANTISYTYTDSAPQTGSYFGYFTSFSNGGNTMTVNYDNLSVTPEPATMSLLVLGGLAALRRRMR